MPNSFSAGADIDAQCGGGTTALMWAIANNRDPGEFSKHYEVIKWLLDNGAEIDIINIHEQLAIDIAEEKGYENVIELISSRVHTL